MAWACAVAACAWLLTAWDIWIRVSLANGPSFDAPKRNRFYALRSSGDHEESPDVVTNILQVFSIDVYALLDTNAALSIVTLLVGKKFCMMMGNICFHLKLTWFHVLLQFYKSWILFGESVEDDDMSIVIMVLIVLLLHELDYIIYFWVLIY